MAQRVDLALVVDLDGGGNGHYEAREHESSILWR